jgi:hypothetical protein
MDTTNYVLRTILSHYNWRTKIDCYDTVT